MRTRAGISIKKNKWRKTGQTSTLHAVMMHITNHHSVALECTSCSLPHLLLLPCSLLCASGQKALSCHTQKGEGVLLNLERKNEGAEAGILDLWQKVDSAMGCHVSQSPDLMCGG